jgi:hypothetical protein
MTEADDIEYKIGDLESKIDDIEYKADDLESGVDEAKDGIQKLNEDLNIWGLFNEKMIPYVYDKSLHGLLKKLEEKNYKEAVDCFKNLRNKSEIPYPLNIKNYRRKKRVLHCTIFLKNAKEFFEVGKIASSDTKPIFYYYSISYLFAFLLHSLVDFNKPKRHHGIYVNTNNGISGIRFNYNLSGGFFERLVHILSMLDYPSSFSSFISDFDNNDQRILLSQKTDISISNKNAILLDKLLEHDFYNDHANLESKIRSRISHPKYKKTSAILRDFILIFVASAIARYSPDLWRNIYSGEDSKLIFYFEKSFNNINDMIRFVNNIITQAEEGRLLQNYNRSEIGKYSF